MLTKEVSTVTETLNTLVATQGLLYVKLHQYHWYVQGPQFFTLHEKFEELYDETSSYFDDFAERLLAIGEKPYSTLTEYLQHSVIKEEVYTEKLCAESMVANLVDDFRTIRDLTVTGIEQAGEANDHVTEDLLIGYKASLDKAIWMLQAYLGKDANCGDK